MARISFDGRKWPGRLHWQFTAERLGDDEHGVWMHVPRGTVARRGTEPPRPLGVGFVALVPAEDWWIVEYYSTHPRHAVYVNIGTPPDWVGQRVTQIDLDLDVVRNLDGSVEILDEDEFLDHQTRYGYPPELTESARSAADTAAELLRNRIEPFDTAPQRWLDQIGAG